MAQVALNFEDGVTRFIETRPGETVSDASYRVGINIPLDCRDGACGTRKCFVEAGEHDGGNYIEDALTDEEAAEGYGLACQMKPKSDPILRIAASSDVCKTRIASHAGEIGAVRASSDTTIGFSVRVTGGPPAFLPGQYVNIHRAAAWPGRFAGEVAAVTGAAQGIGREVVLRLAREGARVVLADRSEVGEDARAGAGGEAVAVLADMGHYAGARAVADRARDAFGRLDVLVNNVGGTIWARPYAEYEEAQIEAEIRRSLFPTLRGCRAALPLMPEGGGGAIVNVSSVATRGVNRVPYAAAKEGMNAMTACPAWECAGSGIRVNAVAPGGTDTPPRKIPRNTFGAEAPGLAAPVAPGERERGWWCEVVEQTVASSPMHRYGTVAEQAVAILFLASDEASYITGVTLPVAGGDLG